MTAARKKLIQQKVHQNITPNINANNRNYKTKLCKHHFKGKVCHRARTCTFAHGEHEQVDLKVAKRAIICINFLKNNCLYGVNCYFCHSEAELRQLTMRLKERVI